MPIDPPVPTASRRGLRVIVVTAALIAAAVVVGGTVTRIADARHLRERAETEAVPTVTVSVPRASNAGAPLELPGRIAAFARAPLYARVSGYLKHWYADIGTKVRAGQLLAEIETPDLDQQLLQARAELATATANAALAETTAKRWQSLLETNAVSRQAVEEKTADLAARQSVVNALRANVERYQAMKRFARIVAPFDGIVTERSTDVGALVNAGSAQGTELFVVSDTRTLRVYVNVPQSYAGAIGRGTKATLTVPESPGKVYPATVQSMSDSISAASGGMLVQLTADNADAELLPGGFAHVNFQVPATAGTWTIPSSALIFDKSGLRVATLAASGKVVLKPIVVARDEGAVIEVSSGLAAHDRIIENPPDGVADGDRVRVAAPDGNETAIGDMGQRHNGHE